MLAWIVPFHEPWAGEAQAWQIARSLSLSQLLHGALRYEGTPGLWHLLLHVLARLHVSYTGMHWVCAALATASTALLLFRSPFPLALRISLPFTFFLAFQFAVVARSYVLVPPLLFAMAALWKRSTLWIALILGLLGNIAFHAFAISIGFAMLYALEARSGLRRLQRPLASVLLLLMLYAAAICIALPSPADLSFHTPLDHPSFHVLARLAPLVFCDYLLLSVTQHLLLALVILTAVLASVALCLGVRYLIPVTVLAAAASGLYFNFWHIGLLIPTLIATFWIGWDRFIASPRDLRRAAVVVASAAWIGLHLAWTVYALHFDRTRAYAPDAAAARMLAPFVAAGVPLAVTTGNANTSAFYSVALAPYFDHPIFRNEPLPYWRWSNNDHTDAQYDAALAQHPGIVVVIASAPGDSFDPQRDLSGPHVAALRSQGYRFTHLFCGQMPREFAPTQTICEAIFQR